MINRTQLVMLVIVFAMGLFYVFHDIKGKPQREEAEVKAKRLFPNLKKDEILAITVEGLKDKKFQRTIKHERGLWLYEGPEEKMVLSTQQLGQVTKSLAEVQRTEELAETPGQVLPPEEFGLDKPSYKITLKSKDGQSYVLTLGDKTPDGNGFYAQAGPNASIERISTTLNELLSSEPETLRETSPVPFEPSRANKVVITSSKGNTVAVGLAKPREKSADDSPDDGVEITDLNEEWVMLPPTVKEGETRKADGQKIRDAIWAWKNVKHVRFGKLSDKIDFSKPLVRFEAWVDGEKDPFVFEVGPSTPGKPSIHYIRRLNPEEILIADISDFKLLDPKPEAFEQRHLSTFEVDDIQRISAKIGDQEVVGKKSGPDWKLQKPDKLASDPGTVNMAVNDLVWDQKNLEWAEKRKEPAQWTERAKVQMFGKKDEMVVDVSLGPVEGKGALVKTKDGVFFVETDPLKKWEGAVSRMRDVAASPTPGASGTPAAPSGGFVPGAPVPAGNGVPIPVGTTTPVPAGTSAPAATPTSGETPGAAGTPVSDSPTPGASPTP